MNDWKERFLKYKFEVLVLLALLGCLLLASC
jgi:predicted small secreted protein